MKGVGQRSSAPCASTTAPDRAQISDLLIAKLGLRAVLDDADRDAIRSLPITVREHPSHAHVSHDSDRSDRCTFLLSGFAHRYKLTAAGNRQIVGILVPGDFIALQQTFFSCSGDNTQSLTRLYQACIIKSDLLASMVERPAIGRALMVEAFVESSISREMVLNIGRRDAPARLAHLLCEFETRLMAIGLAGRGHQLPMTQEQIGDALGIHTVHAHRTLNLLQTEGLLVRDRRTLRIIDWAGIQRRAGYNPDYLGLPVPQRAVCSRNATTSTADFAPRLR